MYAEKLKHWRAMQELTQIEAAQRLGIGLRTYQNYERGAREPDDVWKKRIEKKIGSHTPVSTKGHPIFRIVASDGQVLYTLYITPEPGGTVEVTGEQFVTSLSGAGP